MKRVLFVVLVILLANINIYAQNIPQLVNYQGKLSDANGNPLATAEYEMSFSIYTEKNGGTLVWGPQEFRETNKVTVAKGFFNVILGPVDSTNRTIEEAFKNPNAYLEISVNGNVILPRQQVLSTSYAFQAQKAVKADEATVAVDGVTPVGSVITWMTETAPDGYLECDGRSLLKTEYPELFAVLGYKYGGEDDNFNLPDLRGQFLRGWSHGNEIDSDPDRDTRTDRGDGITGNNVGTKQSSQNKSHYHSMQSYTNWLAGNGYVQASGVKTLRSLVNTTPDGGKEARPKNVYVMYCIKYKKYNK